jgi:hypothetical protein
MSAMRRKNLVRAIVVLALAVPALSGCEDGPTQTSSGGGADRCAYAQVSDPCTDTSGKDCVLNQFGGGIACVTHVRCEHGVWKRTGEGTCDGDGDAGADATPD